MPTGIIRLIARAIHFMALFGLGCYVGGEYAGIQAQGLQKIGHFAGVASLVSGLVNYYFLRRFKANTSKRAYRAWVMLVHSKILLVLVFLTPIVRLVVKDSQAVNTVRVYVIGFMILSSPVARYIRESNTDSVSSDRGTKEE